MGRRRQRDDPVDVALPAHSCAGEPGSDLAPQVFDDHRIGVVSAL